MRNDYNFCQNLSCQILTNLESSLSNNDFLTKFFKNFLTIFLIAIGLNFSFSQTTLISPTGDGGFENGATFAANGWTVANSANNPWIVGPLSDGAITGNAAFISNNASTPSYSLSSSCSNYFYRDVTVPAGQTIISLSFNWIANGESTWDLWQVFVAPTTVTPVGGSHPGSGATSVPTAISGSTWVANGNLKSTVQTANVTLPPTLAGTTFRLIFHWKSDTSGGSQPPAQIDNISLTSEISFVSIATGNWNDPTIWDQGTVPTCGDVVIIGANSSVTVNSAANVSKNVTINANGELIVASGDLTVGCTLNNNSFINNGTLTVSEGALNINGSLSHNSGATFNQSGGDINIDGNAAGVIAESASSYHLNLAAVVNWTGGTLTIVDPHANTTARDVLYYNLSTTSNVSSAHTLRFGDGISTDAGGNAIGFKANTYVGSGRINYGNLVINGGAGTNRIVTGGTYSNVVRGNLTINPDSEYVPAITVFVAGDFINNGIFTQTGTLTLSSYSGTSAAVSTNAQTISGTGVFRNLATTPTANLTSLTVNNNNSTGVTLNVPLSVSGTLTMTSGIINTTNTNLLTLGTATATGTLSGTQSATNMVKGPFARTIANANSSYVLFPVGKSIYNPIWLAPATTSVSVMKAEAFDENTGTVDASIASLSSTKRWEAPLVSGTFTNINVRMSDVDLIATNIPVQAPVADGVYTNSFGSVATYVAGPPITVQSNMAAAAVGYSGFLSYATSNACSGTPAPGNTIASSTTVCLGASVNLSLQNGTNGTGVTYQWKSSLDGVTYSDVALATNATLEAVPTVETYYKCVVTCDSGPSIGESMPIQITFTNNVVTTTPATRCGTGTVDLLATGSAGSTIKWYASASGGSSIGTGNSFTTPVISNNTTYYVASETTGGSLFGGKLAPETSWTGSTLTNWGIVFTALQTTTLNSVDVYSTSAGTLDVKVTNASGVELYATGNINVAAGGTATPTVIPLEFNIVEGTTYKILVKASTGVNLVRGSTNLAFPYNNGAVNVTSSEWGGTTTGTYYYFYNFTTPNTCSSPRVEIVATVTTPPTFTLSASSAEICNGSVSDVVTITAGASDYDTFVWSPLTGVSGNEVTGWTFNPTEDTSYTLNASQSAGAMCTTMASVNITVNPLPTTITITPTSASTCINSIQSLVATGGTIGSMGSTTIGNGTTVTTQNGTEPTAFNNRYEHYWMQMVFTATELNAAGVQAGNINGIKFNITTIGSATSVSDYRVYMGSTALDVLTGFVTSGMSEVFATPTYTQAIGINNIVFDTPYVWDGISNIIVDVRSTGADSVNNSSTYYTETSDNKIVTAITSTTFASSNAFVASNPSGTLSLKRLNTTFDWTSNQPVSISWSPITDLYTDAAATIAYNLGENANTVYVKSATIGTTTYSATATSNQNCERIATVDVTFNNCNIDWANLQHPGTSTKYTCESETFYAQVFKSGITEAAGQGSGISAWIGYSTSDTDPSSWAESDWHLATFNVQAGNNDEYSYAISGLASGSYYVASRFQHNSGDYYYGGFVGGAWDGTTNVNAVLTIQDVPVPVASSQSFCNAATVADLVATGTALNWYVDNATTTALASTDALATATYYVSQTLNGCESERTMVEVTVNVTAAPTAEAQTFCNAATVADLVATGTALNWYVDNATTTALASTDALATATYYVSQTLNGCESERTMVEVTVNAVSAPTGLAEQNISVDNLADATIEDLEVTGTGIVWYPTEEDAINGTNAIEAATQIFDGQTYYAVSNSGTCFSVPFAVTVTVTLGNNSFDLTNLKVYPNPVVDIFTVKYDKEIELINVFDLSGRLVRQLSPKQLETQVDMSDLAAAMYIVKVTADGNQTEIKVMKK